MIRARAALSASASGWLVGGLRVSIGCARVLACGWMQLTVVRALTHSSAAVDAAATAVAQVNEKHRRRGLATWLLDSVEAAAAERGLDGVELTVVRTNDGAIRLYEARGYQDVRIGAIETLQDPQLAISKRMVKPAGECAGGESASVDA